MAHEYELKFTQEPTQELKFCQQGPSSSTSGITGVGSVDYVTKIKTLVGADGSAIVTIGNSDILDTQYSGFWRKLALAGEPLQLNLQVVSSNGQQSQLLLQNTLNTDGRFKLLSVLDGIGSKILGEKELLNARLADADDIDLSKLELTPTTAVFKTYQNTYLYDVAKVYLDTTGIELKLQNSTNPFDISLFKVGQFDLLVSSPNITLGTVAQFITDGSGNIALRSISDGTTGQVLTTNGAGTLSWTTVSGSSGITSLNTLTGATQTFVNDTNITIVSAGTTHTLTWAGTLAAGRLNSNVVQAITNDTNITGSITAQNLTLGWAGTLADARIASAATWNAKESALTFSTGLTRATNTITNDLLTGHAGGQTIISGTAATDKLVIQTTSGNQVTGASNLITFKSGNNGANELLRIGDGIAIGELAMWAAGQSSNTTHWVRAGTNFTYFNAGTDLRLMVGATNYINMLSGSGTVAIQKPLTFASGANVTLVANSTSLASLVFTGGGTYKTTPIAGGVEYNGQFSMTPTDATRRFVTLAASSTKTTAGAPYTNDGYVTLNINGTDVKVMTTA